MPCGRFVFNIVRVYSIINPNIRFSIIRYNRIAMKWSQCLTDCVGWQKILSPFYTIACATPSPTFVLRVGNFGKLGFQSLLNSVGTPKVRRRYFVLAVVCIS